MSEAAISEAASKKRKRGRQKQYNDETLGVIRGLFPEITTERGAIEVLLWVRAFSTIQEAFNSDPQENTWALYFHDPKNGKVFHKSALAQIERTAQSDNDVLLLAREIARSELQDKEAIARLRSIRCGKTPKPDFIQLCVRMEKAINTYFVEHPDTPEEWRIRSLRELAELYENADDEDHADA